MPQLFTAIWSEVRQRKSAKEKIFYRCWLRCDPVVTSCLPLSLIMRPCGEVPEMKIIIHQKNMSAVVYNACRRNHNGVKRKQKGTDGRPVAPWLLFKGWIVQRGVKMSWRRNEFSVWCKTPQVIPVSSEMLHNTQYKRKNCILITQASEESPWVIY